MNAFLLISIIIITVVLLIVNVYLLAIYIHPDDKGFGVSILPKIVVVNLPFLFKNIKYSLSRSSDSR